MQRSAARICTTHVGSLARPPALPDLMRAAAAGQLADTAELAAGRRRAVADVVAPSAAPRLDCGDHLPQAGPMSVPFPEPTTPAPSRTQVFLRYLDYFRCLRRARRRRVIVFDVAVANQLRRLTIGEVTVLMDAVRVAVPSLRVHRYLPVLTFRVERPVAPGHAAKGGQYGSPVVW